MNTFSNAHGFHAVRGKNGEISYVNVGGGQPLADDYGAYPFKIEYSLFGGETLHGDTYGFSFKTCEKRENKTVLTYKSNDGAVLVTVRQNLKDGLFTQTVQAQNLSEGRLCLKQLYNFFNGIDTALLNDCYAERVKIGVIRSEWGAEGQIYWHRPEELGVIRPTRHKTGYTGELFSPTSLTTKRYMPLVFFRDENTGYIWFVQHMPDGPYCIEIGLTDRENTPGSFFNAGCGAGTSERHGFRLYLEKGEIYTCSESACGCGENLDACMAALTKLRREELHPATGAPLMFNDYMNCLWTKQNERDSIALIDVAASVGAEGFCFDDGWYRESEAHGLTHLGDWTCALNRFGKYSFRDMISYIRSKGMTAGLWTELEVCSLMSDASKLPDECFLQNEGRRIFKSNRLYFNLANAAAKEYLSGCVDRIYDMGIRFIKNDYNGHPGSGVDWKNASCVAGLEQHMRAVNAFYAEIRRKYPDLYLENCSSGAMRADANTNRNFHLQSVSDCEEYYKIPSILSGTLLGLLPEQTGVWVYPYPRVFWEMNGDDYLTEEYLKEMSDGEQTIFNMISGIMGAMYLSGKIDKADELNISLVKQGVSLYKNLRPFIAQAVPFYPLPFTHIYDEGFTALGLRKDNRAVLAVWRTGAEGRAHIPLKGIRGAKELYPCRNFAVNVNDNCVDIGFTKPVQAVLLEITY